MPKENILDEVYKFLGKYVWFPNENYRVATTAWVAHTHLIDAFSDEQYPTPRLSVLSPEKRSGKTRLLEVIKLLVQNPEGMVSPSSSSIYGLIDGSKTIPTLLIDEIGRTLEKKDISEFIAIVEAGFQPGQPITRTSFEHSGKRKVERFKLYAPMLMAGLDNGRMPDTITDRSIVLRMKRNIGKRLSYRPRKHAAEGKALAEKLAEWSRNVVESVKDIELHMPDKLNDREQDKWEPLFIVGRLADGTAGTVDTDGTTFQIGIWEERIRNSALLLSYDDKEIDTVSRGEVLLKDTESVFNNIDKIKTAKLLEDLNNIEESPWATYSYGKPLDAMGLAKILKPYHIKSKTIRFDDGTQQKGYYKSDFEDAWRRYLGVPSEKSVPIVPDVTDVPDIRISINGSDGVLENILNS